MRAPFVVPLLLFCTFSAAYAAEPPPNEILLHSEDRAVVARGDLVTVAGKLGGYFVKAILLKDGGLTVAKNSGDGSYRLVWNTASTHLGHHALKVVAVRASGEEVVKRLSVQVLEKPPITIASPSPGAELLDPVTIQIAAAAEYTPTQATLYVNNKVYGSPSDPAHLTWDPSQLSPGTYTLSVQTDSKSGLAVSSPITVQVPDRVRLEAPSPDSTIVITQQEPTVTFRPAVHPGLKVSKVLFLCNDDPIAESTEPPFTTLWNAVDAVPGRYRLIARATDTSGRIYDSPPVQFSLENPLLVQRQAGEARKEATREGEQIQGNIERYAEAQRAQALQAARRLWGLSQAGGRIGRINGLSVLQLTRGATPIAEWGELDTMDVYVRPGTGREQLVVPTGIVFNQALKTAKIYAQRKLDTMGHKIDWGKLDVSISYTQAIGCKIDGDSGGVAIAVGLLSNFLRLPIRAEVTITGAVTGIGEVKPVGGIATKAKAALSDSRILTLIIPRTQESLKELSALPWDLLRGHRIIAAENMEQVLRQSLIGYDNENLAAAATACIEAIDLYEQGKPRQAIPKFQEAYRITPEDLTPLAWINQIRAELATK